MEFRHHWLKDWYYSVAKEEENIHSTQVIFPFKPRLCFCDWVPPLPVLAWAVHRPQGPVPSWHQQRESQRILPGVSFHLDCHNDTQPGTIHCQGSIMSFLCNVCDYLSNCHDIVCQFLLLNRGRQTERGRETQMFIWRRYLNARDKIRHQHNGKSLKQSDLNAPAVSVML